jgi:two-component system chemotaxis response regulator CheB
VPQKDIIAIGGSAGSSAALQQIVADLPADLPASVFIATHVPTHSHGYLAEVLARCSRLPVRNAIAGEAIEKSRIYVAVPDRHLMVVDGTIHLGEGPRENMSRPAIDPLFRSAALSYGPRAVGVVLSGMLNDGASGLWAIKQCGGTAIVQHPLDASADQMPLAALEAVQADAVARADELGTLLTELAGTEAGKAVSAPPSLELDVEIASGRRLGSEALRRIADPAALSCPDCNGVLSEVRDNGPLRYRCQIGHAMTADVLASRTDQVEEAMRIALRMMEERLTLVTRMAADARASGRHAVAELYEQRSKEYGRYAATLRDAAVGVMRSRQSPADEN